MKKIATFWQLLDTFIGNFFGIHRQLVAKPTANKPKWYSNETFRLAHLARCLFGTLGVPSYGGIILRLAAIFFIAILQQVQNGIDSDCISFRLENLIDLLLRSAHLYQDGGQVLAVLRAASI